MRLAGIFDSLFSRCRAHLCVMLVVAACAASASGQAARRVVVETNDPFPNYPVELVGAEVSGGTNDFTKGEPGLLVAAFDAPDDWLRHFVLKIRNKTDKTILAATFEGSLAVGEGDEIRIGFNLRFGRELDESAFTGRPPRGTPASLAPGETGDASWSEAEYAEMARFLPTKHRLADYRRMQVRLQDVRFDDGTVWTLNGRFRIDPLDPRKWTPIDSQPKSAAPKLKAGERVVEVPSFKPANDPDALVITEIKVEGRPVTPGQPFTAGDDWLRSLSVRVRNTSNKPIAFVQIGFSLPEARYHNADVGHMLHYGRSTAGGGAPDAAPLAPGEEVELTLTEEEFDALRSSAERLSGGFDCHRLRLGTASVRFEDGTRAFVTNPARAPQAGPPAVKN
jgi:hypothetical protein